jgi:hypothetical protein
LERQALVRHTSGNACTSVPTSRQPKHGHDMAKFQREPGRKSPSDLETAVHLASVPTPMAGSPATETYNAAGNNDYSRRIVELATVSTPSARDWKDTAGMSESGVDPDGSTRTRLDQLPMQAQLAASGPTATGGMGETGSGGQLDPAYSRWLMGCRPCSATAGLRRCNLCGDSEGVHRSVFGSQNNEAVNEGHNSGGTYGRITGEVRRMGGN